MAHSPVCFTSFRSFRPSSAEKSSVLPFRILRDLHDGCRAGNIPLDKSPERDGVHWFPSNGIELSMSPHRGGHELRRF